MKYVRILHLLVPPVSASRSTSRVVKNSDVDRSLVIVIVVASLGNGLSNSTSLVHGVSRFMVVFGNCGLPSVCGGGLGDCDDLGGRVLVVVLCECHSFGRDSTSGSDSLGSRILIVGLGDCHSLGLGRAVAGLRDSDSLGDGGLVVGLGECHGLGGRVLVVVLCDCHSFGGQSTIVRLGGSNSLGSGILVVCLRDCHSLRLSETIARLGDSDSLDGWDIVAGLSVGDCSCNGDCFTIKAKSVVVVSRDSKGDWNGSKKESWCRELHNAEMLRSVVKMIGRLNECWIVVHSRACTPDDLYRCH